MKNILRNSYLINVIIFRIGYLLYSITGKTLYLSYKSMINLYCITNGQFLNKLNNSRKFKDRISGESAFFNDLNEIKIKSISNNIRNEGYSIFDQKLNINSIKKLKKLSLNMKAKVGKNYINFDPENKVSNIYKFSPNEIIKDKLVQDLVMDPILINIAGEYLGTDPIFDFVAMWWSTDSNNKTDDAAQDFHFDLDRPRWLKIFLYLTDVNEKNGPHCYIAKSHKVGNKPHNILKRGYVRVSDKELIKYYPKNTFKEIKGPAGTIIFGDTSCWHKGKPISKGERLILQLEYTSSLFGYNMPKLVTKNYSDQFKEFCKKNKHYSQNIELI